MHLEIHSPDISKVYVCMRISASKKPNAHALLDYFT